MDAASDRAIAPEILAAARDLELRARRAVREGLGGRWTSAVRGPGVEFAEVREYVVGDDARTLDWNVSARTGRLHVKRFDEEREQTLFFLLDGSRSCRTAGATKPWPHAAAELLALLGLAAADAGDRIGAAFFSEGLDRIVPPRHGSTALLALLAQWLAHAPPRAGTDLDATLREFLRLRARPCLVLVVTDLHDRASDATWSAMARRHDLVVLALRPPWFDLPAAVAERGGCVRFADPESARRRLVDLGDARVRAALRAQAEAERHEMAQRLRRAGAELVELASEGPLVAPLSAWTRERARRRER
jgi:uncharacterized protein (DUF58 family)